MKRTKKIISLLFAAISIMCLLTACGKPADKTFTTSTKVSITLTDAFALSNQDGLDDFDAVYFSPVCACAILTESISSLESMGYEEMTEKEYADLLVLAYNDGTRTMGSVSTNAATNLVSFTYTASNEGTTFYYFSVVLKDSTKYCTVTFWCEYKDKDKYQSDFENWAKTIKL